MEIACTWGTDQSMSSCSQWAGSLHSVTSGEGEREAASGITVDEGRKR